MTESYVVKAIICRASTFQGDSSAYNLGMMLMMTIFIAIPLVLLEIFLVFSGQVFIRSKDVQVNKGSIQLPYPPINLTRERIVDIILYEEDIGPYKTLIRSRIKKIQRKNS